MTVPFPELARRVEAQKAKDKAAKERLATELAESQAAERATMAFRKFQLTTRAKTLAEFRDLQRSI